MTESRRRKDKMMMISKYNEMEQEDRIKAPSLNHDEKSRAKINNEYRELYPPNASTNVRNGTIQLDDIHTLYYEEYNTQNNDTSLSNKKGKKETTALFLHGGPGASSNPNHARFFNPELYTRIVLYDQRGCGKSTPKGEIRNNTLDHLVQDIEVLRKHLNVSCWDVILGGSWGVTLALSYAQYYPKNVGSMVLRGVFCLRPEEVYWLFGKDLSLGSNDDDDANGGGGTTASFLFREQWKLFEKAVLPPTKSENIANQEEEKSVWEKDGAGSGWDVLYAYYDRLLGDDAAIRLEAAKSWFTWEMGVYSNSSSHSAQQKSKNGTASNTTSVNKTSSASTNVTATSTKSSSYPLLSYNEKDGWLLADGAENKNEHNDDDNQQKIVEFVQNLRRWSEQSCSADTKKFSLSQISNTPLQPRRIRPVLTDKEDGTKMNETQLKQLQQFIPAQAMLTCYYSANAQYMMQNFSPFSPTSSQQKKNIQEMFSTIPCIAIQGGNDLICPPDTTLDLHNEWKEMNIRIPLKGGHSMYDDAIASEIVKAIDYFGDKDNRRKQYK